MKALLVLAFLFLSGCAPGLIYTDITVPLTTNMEDTPIGKRLAAKETVHYRLPIPRAGVRAEWASRAIGEAAKEGGLEKIYYADLHTVSYLAGTWQRQTIRVWGE